MTADRNYCFLFDGGPPLRGSATMTPAPAPVVPLTTRPVHVERQPVITSTRGPRFVAHAICPMCGVDGQGVEDQGELRDGTKVRTIFAHSPEMRRVDRKRPRCLGSGMRVELVDGVWQGAAKP